MSDHAALDVNLEDLLEAKPEVPPIPPGLYHLRLDPDLKGICRTAGLRVGGKKSEVLARIEHAWAQDSPSGREAVRRALGEPEPLRVRLQQGLSGGSMDGHLLVGFGASSNSSSSNASNTRLQCWCTAPGNWAKSSPYLVTCAQCQMQHHANCVQMHPSEVASKKDWTCCACRATWLDPFSPVLPTERIDGMVVDPGRPAAARQQFQIVAATPSQIAGHSAPSSTSHDFEIAGSVVFALMGGVRRLEMRCFLPNPPYGRIVHRWPLRSAVYVNGVTVGALLQQPQVRGRFAPAIACPLPPSDCRSTW